MPALLTEGLGLAVCDKQYHVTIIDPPRGPSRIVTPPRESSGKRLPHESAADLVTRVLDRTRNLPAAIGISYHDADAVDEIVGLDTRLVHVFPTVATLAGLRLIKDTPQVMIQRGSGDYIGQPSALLKIGPRKVTYAIEGDPTAAPNYIEAGTIGSLSDASAAVFEFIGSPANADPIELLGNRGWRNAATYFAETNPATLAGPSELTAHLLKTLPRDRVGARTFTSHLAVAASNDPFARQVALHMIDLFGRVVGFVSQRGNYGTLFVQYNAVTAVSGMPNWVINNAGTTLFGGINAAGGSDSEIILTGPRPQVAEAYGASQLAAALFAA